MSNQKEIEMYKLVKSIIFVDKFFKYQIVAIIIMASGLIVSVIGVIFKISYTINIAFYGLLIGFGIIVIAWMKTRLKK
jgi:hypothetical protein